MKISSIVIMTLFLLSAAGKAQVSYPFLNSENDKDIRAYWYNVKRDSVCLKKFNATLNFCSALQVYGKAPGDSFIVKTHAYSKTGEEIFSRNFDITKYNKNSPYSFDVNNGFFKIECPVDYLETNPARIDVTIESPSGRRSKQIECRYHKLYGDITDFDGNPFMAFVFINPDAFGFSANIWSDSSGYYEIELPERTYNNLAVDDETYAVTTTEAWAWHVILDSDQRLDFKVGTGEVYNLNVWSNNGGGNAYFVSFRPMTLYPNLKGKEYSDSLNGREIQVMDSSPDLMIEDIRITVNGKEARILSLQKYYETGGGIAMPAYLLQVSKNDLERTGKQTVLLEFEKEMEIEGEKLLRNSMGYFQFYLNFGGLSTY